MPKQAKLFLRAENKYNIITTKVNWGLTEAQTVAATAAAVIEVQAAKKREENDKKKLNFHQLNQQGIKNRWSMTTARRKP